MAHFLSGKIRLPLSVTNHSPYKLFYGKKPSVDREPALGEDPKRWVLQLLKGLYGIKQGPQIWVLKLHSVLVEISFERTDCDYSVYIHKQDNIKVILPIHVDDLLIASNSCNAIQKVKSDLASCFKIHNQSSTTSILGIKIAPTNLSASPSPAILNQYSNSLACLSAILHLHLCWRTRSSW